MRVTDFFSARYAVFFVCINARFLRCDRTIVPSSWPLAVRYGLRRRGLTASFSIFARVFYRGACCVLNVSIIASRILLRVRWNISRASVLVRWNISRARYAGRRVRIRSPGMSVLVGISNTASHRYSSWTSQTSCPRLSYDHCGYIANFTPRRFFHYIVGQRLRSRFVCVYSTDVAVTLLQGFAERFIANFTPRRSTSTLRMRRNIVKLCRAVNRKFHAVLVLHLRRGTISISASLPSTPRT